MHLILLIEADAHDELDHVPHQQARKEGEQADGDDADQLGYEACLRVGKANGDGSPHPGKQVDRDRTDHVIKLDSVEEGHTHRHDHAADGADQNRLHE